MTIWSGLGMNYGHDVTNVAYNTTQVESDFSFLKAQGITRLRIAFPGYASSATIANCQDMVLRALSHGFYVVWGISTGVTSPNLTATLWASVKATITGSIASWAKDNSLSELCLCNEPGEQVDGTTLTAATVRSDIRAMCATVKSGGFTGKVSFSTSTTQKASWISEGIGTLDLIGFNAYDTLTNFTTNVGSVFSSFGASGYVSEFGAITTGFGDYNDENSYATDVLARISAMQSAGIGRGYFFCYRDGGSIGANTFGLVQTSGVAHCVRGAILNTPGQKIFSMVGV